MRKWLGLLGVLVAFVAVAGWFCHTRILSWYYVQQLSSAQEQRDTWSRQTAELGSAAVADLVACLRRDDKLACTNAAHCLSLLVAQWGPDDSQTTNLLQKLVDQFDVLSVPGQQAVLELAGHEGMPTRGVAAIVSRAAKVAEVRPAALALAQHLPPSPDIDKGCQQLVCACLRDANPDCRIEAVELAFHCGIPEQALTLLRDERPEVRRAAILRLGPATEVIGTDELLLWLHDVDPEVRKLCESALRGRGLLPEHVQMGRLITDPRSTQRLRVLDHLQQNAELEPGIWLRRLSHDASPAVRAASIRAATEQALVDLSDRIEQMAANDPSPTVRQLARFYLNYQNLP